MNNLYYTFMCFEYFFRIILYFFISKVVYLRLLLNTFNNYPSEVILFNNNLFLKKIKAMSDQLEAKIDHLIQLQAETLKTQKSGFLTHIEFAERTGLEPHVIIQKCLKLQLAHRKEGRTILIPYSELERWLKEAEEQRLVDEKFKTRRNRLIIQAKDGRGRMQT